MKRTKELELRIEDLIPKKYTTRQNINEGKGLFREGNVEEILEEVVPLPDLEVSEYEKMRLENIRKNEEMMRFLNIQQPLDVSPTLSDSNKVKPTSLSFTPRCSAVKKPVDLTPTRRSRRIEMKTKDETLQTQFYSPPVNIPMRQEKERKPTGPVDMVPFNDIVDEESKTFLKSLSLNKVKQEKLSENAQVYRDNIAKLRVLPKNVAKIVPQRVYSLAFHPSSTKPILCVGDKSGSIGFWDLEAKRENNNGIFVYDPHVRPVTSISFQPQKDMKLYSCSYDGTVRCADFHTCIFNEVYSLPEDDGTGITGLSYSSCDVLLLSQTNGKVVIVDTRSGKSKNSVYDCHPKAVKCVHCSPTNSNAFCTSSADATVALWDIRKMTSKLDSTSLGRSVSSAYFSPNTGNQILATSFADTLTLFDVSTSTKLEKKHAFRHFNQTGRWITPFKATWDPKNDCGIVVGSMKFPRRVDIYHFEQKGVSPLVELSNENYDTITPINAFHPNRNMLASGNSSGKVYIWTESNK